MRERKAFIYHCFYSVAEFGDEYVVIEADNKERADILINEWCHKNYCTNFESPSGLGPKPYLTAIGFLVKC
jgi:hypothetical protein